MGAVLMLPVKGGFSYIVEFFPFITSSFQHIFLRIRHRKVLAAGLNPVAWHPLSRSIELPLGSASGKRAVWGNIARMLFCFFATARLPTHVSISLPFHLPPDPLSMSTPFLFNKSLLPRFPFNSILIYSRTPFVTGISLSTGFPLYSQLFPHYTPI